MDFPRLGLVQIMKSEYSLDQFFVKTYSDQQIPEPILEIYLHWHILEPVLEIYKGWHTLEPALEIYLDGLHCFGMQYTQIFFLQKAGKFIGTSASSAGFLHSITLWRLVSMRVCMCRRVQLCVNASMYPQRKLSIIQGAHDEGLSSERDALYWGKNLGSFKCHTHLKWFRSVSRILSPSDVPLSGLWWQCFWSLIKYEGQAKETG